MLCSEGVAAGCTVTDTHDHYNQIYIKGRNIQSNCSKSDVSKTSSVTSVTFAACAYNLKSGQNIEPKLSNISWRHSGLIKLVAANTERQILTSIREYLILIYFLLCQV